MLSSCKCKLVASFRDSIHLIFSLPLLLLPSAFPAGWIVQWFRYLAAEQNLGVWFPIVPPASRVSLYGLGQAAQSQGTPRRREGQILLSILYLENLKRVTVSQN